MSSTIKCEDCGSTNVTKGQVAGLAVCPHCGMVMPIPEGYTPAAAVTPESAINPGHLEVPDEEVEVPDEIGYELGWRAWIVQSDWGQRGFPLLQSANQMSYWPPREVMIAKCNIKGADQQTIPHEPKIHRCGLYSAKTLEKLLKLPYPNYNGDLGAWTVLGRVRLWGGVIEGSQGWRSRKGYPDELYVPYEAAGDLAEPLEQTYGVEVGTMNWLGTSYV